MRDLGEIVLEHHSSGPLIGQQHLQLHRGGFRAQIAGSIAHSAFVEAAWTEVLWVKRIDRTSTINGITADDAVWVHVGVASGQVLVFCGKRSAPGAEHAANALFDAAKPHVDERVFAELQSGRHVYFGATVRASMVGIEVNRRGSWRLLRREDIAGWRVSQATLMIDRDPQRPELFCQLFFGKVDNAETLVDVLRWLTPDKDLARFPYRMPGSVWRTSAATHDPRYVSTRTRMLALSIVGAPMVLFVLLFLARFATLTSGLGASGADDRDAKDARARLEREQHELARAPTPVKELADACAGVTAADVDQVVVLATSDLHGMRATMPSFRVKLGTSDGFARSSRPDSLVNRNRYALARVLPASRVVRGGGSEVRMHVRLFEPGTGRVRCEGLARGAWTEVEASPTEEHHEDSTRQALARIPIAVLCAERSSSVCRSAVSDESVIRLTVGDARTGAVR